MPNISNIRGIIKLQISMTRMSLSTNSKTNPSLSNPNCLRLNITRGTKLPSPKMGPMNSYTSSLGGISLVIAIIYSYPLVSIT